MSWKERWTTMCASLSVSWFDVIILGSILIAGLLYLHDPLHWGVGWIGQAQYGDAEFWWNGALHLAQGIFQDNPGKGFRPGYFLLTGLTLPVLGQQFQQYYPYFLFAFLSVAGFFYLSLRQSLGPWISAGVVGLLIINPYTAEWLATSTTDSTGLLLNIAALSCLLIGVNKDLKRFWLIAFGILFSLATLTRPLVTPFIGFVFLALLILPKAPIRKKISIVVCIFLAFCLPTFLWMVVQKVTIDRWSLSSNDASAFYAASDPTTQVWNGGAMYDHIQQLATERYHVKPAQLTDRMINQTFWHETINNYLKYPGYHLSRLVPHIVEIARFGPKMATHGTNAWRIFFFEIITFGLTVWLLLQRRRLHALLLIAISFCIYLTPSSLTYMTLLGAFLAIATRGRNNQLGIFLLSAYWLIGVVALFLVGGTWGKPSFTPLFAINALGYRLGSQIFFVGDLLAAFFLARLANYSHAANACHSRAANACHPAQLLARDPATLAGGVVLAFFGIFLTLLTSIYLMGGFIVAKRIYARHNAVVQPYPELDSIKKIYQQYTGRNVAQGKSDKGGLDNKIYSQQAVKEGNKDIIFTGTFSSFIWNMPGQARSQIKVYVQNQVSPFTMGPGSIFLDLPEHVRIEDWAGKQGAFIIRQLPDNHNLSNQAYYLTVPALRAFIPVAEDGKSFNFAKAIWFPLVKNATQLETSGELQAQHAKITWAVDSGQALYQRRFFILPQQEKAELILKVSKIKGAKELAFSYAIGETPGTTSAPITSPKKYEIKIATIKHSKQVSVNQVDDITKDTLNKKILTIPADAEMIKMTFANLPANVGIWIYEFNLSSANPPGGAYDVIKK